MIVWLIFIQFLWSSSYIAQKMALAEMPVGLILIFRYGFTTLGFLLLGYLRLAQFSRKEWLLIGLIGILNFTGSPYFQLNALKLTYAIDTSVIVAFEPLIATLLAVFFLKETLKPFTLLTFLLAITGVLIMASAKGDVGVFQWSRLLGDAIFFCSLFCEGLYSVSSRHLTQKYHPLTLAAWMMLAGFLANLLGNGYLLTKANLTAISWVGWANLVFLALFCTGLAYGVWSWLLHKTPVSQLCLSLFLQPIFGSLLAVWLLKEPFDRQTALGAALILLTLLIWVVWQLKRLPSRASLPDGVSKDSQTSPVPLI